MAIRRRTVTKQGEGPRHRLRHPLLRHGTTTLMLYNFIKQHPGCTRKDLNHLSTSGQPLSDLVKEGLVLRRGEKRTSYTYEAVPENETGPGRDQVEVELDIFVNDYGEYSFAGRMIGQRLTAHEDFPRKIMTKRLKLSVPSPNEPYKTRQVLDVEDLQTFAKPQEADPVDTRPPLIIDGDWTTLSKK